MKITEVTVHAGRTFNHPHEDYSNLRPQVTLRAVLGEEDDALQCARELQAKAEGLVEDHKRSMLESLEELYHLGQRQAEVRGLQQQLQNAQDRLDVIRRAHPDLHLVAGPGQTVDG